MKRIVVARTAFIVGSLTFSDIQILTTCSYVRALNSRGGKDAFHCIGPRSKTQLLLHDSSDGNEGIVCHTPLVFVPGLKGTHLSYYEECEDADAETFNPKQTEQNRLLDWPMPGSIGIPQRKERTKRRVWLTLGGLLNVPNLPIDHPHRSLALPLTYDDSGSQDRGHLFPDGVIDHVIQLGDDVSIDLFPFYGHATRYLEEANQFYLSLKNSESIKKTDTTSYCRPTAVFQYDWRRSISELTDEFDNFCESTFPGKPVQIVAHSMGGLISYGAMRRNPQKYQPGGVFAGVPFGTGTQYLEDMHKGYYTELNRCQQFTPIDQFTFSSHWVFFPTTNGIDDKHAFVDVPSNNSNDKFGAGKNSIGRAASDFQPAVEGEKIDIDFYDVNDWKKLELGIFDQKYKGVISEKRLDLFMNHVQIQLDAAKLWRSEVLGDLTNDELKEFPPLVICASDTIPTVNQILRRKRGEEVEFDYKNGRSVAGDGRIDFDKAFPLNNTPHKRVPLNSKHSKQMCKNESGGNWEAIWNEVLDQIDLYSNEQQLLIDSRKQLA